jgi:hypothetical protein
MQSVGGAENRKFPRIEIDLPVVVVGKGGFFKARLTNISLGGCLLEGGLRARVGEILAIKWGESLPPEIFKAKVLWAVPRESTSNFGSSFWGADEPAKREILQRIIRMARPADPLAHLLLG